ncbi:MAG: ribonuclease Y [Candidatus Colwellbacteria bacterium]|nr:ribonuclease Y [Candidatus Colwellbacteria bacterium]
MLQSLLLAALGLGVGLAVGYFVRQGLSGKLKEAELKAKQEAQNLILEAQKKAVSVIEEAKSEEKERKAALDKHEVRLVSKEELLLKKEGELDSDKTKLSNAMEALKKEREELLKSKEETAEKLSKIAGLTQQEAKDRLIKEIEDRHKEELTGALFKLMHERKAEIEKKAQEIMTTAVQRMARTQVSDITTSAFTLPSEDLKGKIIGREGRNIRALERATGTELIMDESPDTIIISSFDPMRREIARVTLQKLIQDGRIQPAKIEEKVQEAKDEIDERIYKIGEEAAHELSILNLPKEILQLLGRLNFRTSFGQNVLTHSIEMAHIAGMMASELGANIEVAKRGALLHDIGKAIDHEVQGTHVELGRKILKKYGVDEAVIRAMESHHEEYPFSTPEAFIVTAADALSAARPGARRGTLETYIKRLGDLEKLASGFPGVKNAYAISAGREVRVFVVPEQIDDFGALQLAKDIAMKVESDLKYPGEVKVNVIREMRAVEYAK